MAMHILAQLLAVDVFIAVSSTFLTYALAGVYTWSDASKYEGEWKDGVKHGKKDA